MMKAYYLIFALSAVTALATATWIGRRVAVAGFPLGATARRIGCLDGMRGYLALAVILHHFIIWVQDTRLGGGWLPPESNFLNQLGAGAVGLFFMITGLVFYPRIRAGFDATAWSEMTIGRIYRIIPLTAFSVALIAVIVFTRTREVPGMDFPRAFITWITAQGQPPLLGDSNAARVNARVLWSLEYEWLFYLYVMPLCALAIDATRALRLPDWTVPAGLLVTSSALRFAAGTTIGEGSVIFYLPLFAVGMIAWEIQARPAIRARLCTPQVGIIATGALVAGMTLAPHPYGAALPLFAFFFVSVACGNTMGGLLTTRGALVLGECSFGLYLLHGLVLYLFFANGALVSVPVEALPLALPLLLGIATLITAVTYLMIEMPAMERGRHIARRLGRNRSPALAAKVAP